MCTHIHTQREANAKRYFCYNRVKQQLERRIISFEILNFQLVDVKPIQIILFWYMRQFLNEDSFFICLCVNEYSKRGEEKNNYWCQDCKQFCPTSPLSFRVQEYKITDCIYGFWFILQVWHKRVKHKTKAVFYLCIFHTIIDSCRLLTNYTEWLILFLIPRYKN